VSFHPCLLSNTSKCYAAQSRESFMTTTELSPLFDPSLTFSATSAELSKIPTSDQFHLLVRLHDFLTSSEPPNPNDNSCSYEHWICARMKAEWCLWEGYSKWDIALNPFLGHFVEVWDARYSAPQAAGDTFVVGIILSGQAKEVTFYTVWD
jgi:hypothetical protein